VIFVFSAVIFWRMRPIYTWSDVSTLNQSMLMTDAGTSVPLCHVKCWNEGENNFLSRKAKLCTHEERLLSLFCDSFCSRTER